MEKTFDVKKEFDAMLMFFAKRGVKGTDLIKVMSYFMVVIAEDIEKRNAEEAEQ